MEVNLVVYDDACRALQEAVRVDEVKDIIDKAQALAAYAKQAKNDELFEHASKIKKRAEIRAGQILITMKKNGQRQNGHGNLKQRPRNTGASIPGVTLKEIGISANQASRWQRLAGAEPAPRRKRRYAPAVIEKPKKQPPPPTPQERHDACIGIAAQLLLWAKECERYASTLTKHPDKLADVARMVRGTAKVWADLADKLTKLESTHEKAKANA